MTASAMAPCLDGTRAGPLANMLFGAPNKGDIIISSVHQSCQVYVVRYCVAAKNRILRPESRTYGFLLKGDDSFTFRPSFLEFLGAVNLREQLGNAQSAQYSWSIMRGTIEGRPPCLAPNSVLASRSARSPSKLGPSIGEKQHARPKMFGAKRVSAGNVGSDPQRVSDEIDGL